MMVELANMVKGRCLPRWRGSFLPVTSVSDETFLEMGDWDSMSKMYISMWSRASWHVYLCKARVWKDKSILDNKSSSRPKNEGSLWVWFSLHNLTQISLTFHSYVTVSININYRVLVNSLNVWFNCLLNHTKLLQSLSSLFASIFPIKWWLTNFSDILWSLGARKKKY